jgi:hypothetical protein
MRKPAAQHAFVALALLMSLFTSNGFRLGSAILSSNCRRPSTTGVREQTKRFQSTNDDNDRAYGILGTLSRQGPTPALIRLFQPKKYEDAVRNWMDASGETDRNRAQASMDYYFQDPTGWQLNRLQGKDIDYLSTGQDPKELFLTGVFGVGVTIWLVYGTSYWSNYWANDPSAVFWQWSPLLQQ